MLKFIWNSWWRNKERFILLLVGVLILSTGLSYLIGITQANNGTVVEELQKRWKSSYHIVVRPEGSRSVTEELNLLEPNYLSGLEGGITMEQYEQIKAMADVEIAAPIAMMGSVKTSVQLDQLDITEPGVYRMNILEETDTGVAVEEFGGNTYFTIGKWVPAGLGQEYGATPEPTIKLTYGSEVMIAGIDPIAESALVGIDQAMITGDYSRFFRESDTPQPWNEELQIPVIVSNEDYVDAKMTYTIEKLDFPFTAEEQSETMEGIKEKGGQTFLDTQEGSPVQNFVYSTDDVHAKMVEKILDPSKDFSVSIEDFTWMSFKPSPVEYKTVTSPFGERWPFSYQVQPYSVPEDIPLAVRNMYRPINMFGSSSDDWPRLRLNYIGVFNPEKLKISKDPLSELPMETYFPAKAQWVVDAENNPVNPHTDMKPLNNPYGFLTKPPLILTTIEAAAQVLGEEPISAIRVNVAGVDVLNDESEAKLQEVASEIEELTGLITDVTLGSSPQLALTHLPGLDGEEALGWVQQPWIKIGSSVSIFQEAKIGMAGVIASVILVAVVYVFASNIIMLYARKKEFAVLLSLGWRPSQLSKLLLLESTLLGALVALISWLILGIFLVSGSIDTSFIRVFLIGVSGLAIYWLGSLIPIALIQRIKPFESMRSGEVSHRAKRIVRSESVIGMSFNNLFSQWQRSVLSVLAIAVPTSLFIFFLFVTFRLKGILYATWLGEFVALEVGTMHYVAMGVALLIAILTTTEIMWQNVSERQSQIAVLKATGWQNSRVRALVLWEGVLTGLLAGIIGMGIGLVIIYSMYGQLPTEEFGLLSLTLLIPIITGVLGALLPAKKAARILPYQAINGTLHNSKKVEKQFKWIIGSAGASLVAGILVLFIYAIPESNTETAGNVIESSEERTEGKLSGTTKPLKENQQPTEEDEPEPGASGFADLKKDAWKVLSPGQSTDDNPLMPILTFGNLAEPPAGVSPENPENTLLSIPVSLKEQTTMWYIFKPNAYKLFNEDGKEYVPVHVEKINVGNWQDTPSQYRVDMMGEVNGDFRVILTYEVPKNHGALALYLNTLEYASGPVVVDIPPSETAAASGLSPGASASYSIDLTLDEQDAFQISAEIDVTNESVDSWQDIGFYFIPNALTDANKPEYMEDGADVEISSVTSNGVEIPFELDGNRLLLELDKAMEPDEMKKVKIDYTLVLPENGIRLAQVDDNFYLAQWYPMLGHYEDGWKIEDFDSKGESYHTSYGSYQIDYQLPGEYLVASSAPDGEISPVASGTLKGDNIKDFYLAFLDPDAWHTATSSVNNTALRVYAPADGPDFTADMLDVAEDAFSFFEEKILDHPSEELDIIGNDGGMEYPNIIEVNGSPDEFEHTLVHEIAHQWFYYLVASDPFEDAWLDESLTEWLSSMYMVEEGYPDPFAFSEGMASQPTAHFINLPLDEFEDGEYYATVYGKAPLLLQEYFEENGGSEEAFAFLSAYAEQFHLGYVDSELFAAFFEEQLGEDNREFLESWLEIE